MLKKIIIFLVLTLISMNVVSKTIYIQSKKIHIHDGDTSNFYYQGRKYKIRSSCIDTPELYGPSKSIGLQSKKKFIQLIKNHKVIKFILKGKDRYGRYIGTLYGNDSDINLQMVRQGYAFVYKKYCQNPEYYFAFKQAKLEKKGLFSEGKHITEPWKYRRKYRP